jgi:2-polyprenyl-3-methyl-5-hydroxy-6-metoxy-1,4-benzoquinol methylase
MTDKFRLQSDQYLFPYHYLVDLRTREFVKNLDWGLDYLTYMGRTLDLVKKYLRHDLLDVGCGDGSLLYNLALEPSLPKDIRAVGIDLDERAIKFAQAFSHGLPRVRFAVQDLAALEDEFDVVTTVETLEHIPDEALAAFTSHIDRLLKPEGVLIISVPSKVRAVIEKHYRHYDLEMLRAYFPGYDVLEVHYMTARQNIIYQILAKLLSHRHFNLNFRPFKNLLLGVHERFTSEVAPERGAHIVAAFRKP